MKNTLFTGKVYYRFDELPSTNDYARDLLAKSRPAEGTVVRADSQSAGRGQFGSKWMTEPGVNLTLSVILYPNWLKITDQFRLSEAVALALLDTVNRLPSTVNRQPSTVYRLPSTVYRLPSTIKWPNDIYLGDRKTAGILIQNTLTGNHLETSIIGIGLNVNQTAFPPEIPNATSLALATGRTFDLEAVADTLFECLERRYLQLKAGQTEVLRAEYREHLLGLGVLRNFARPDGSVFSGIIQGVQEDGRLEILGSNGLELFDVKAIQMLQA
jgi:BirA family biotin operon repressor/biotin-[acetyl-CoA-carboxylase] ligase